MATYPPPLFVAGQVVDTRYDTNIAGINVGMPDRNYIDMVYRREDSDTWLLGVISEAKGGSYHIKQDQLFNNQSNHNAAVYELPDVQMMLRLGYRFVKNMPVNEVIKNNASALIEGLKKLSEIDEIVTMDAIGPDGMPFGDNGSHVGIWIKYKKIISYDHQNMPDYIQVYKA